MGEAAIKKFLDTIDHDGMVRMLAERLDDSALLRLIGRAGHGSAVVVDGRLRARYASDVPFRRQETF